MEDKIMIVLTALSLLWSICSLTMYALGLPVLWMFPNAFAELGTFFVWWQVINKTLTFEERMFEFVIGSDTRELPVIQEDQWLQ